MKSTRRYTRPMTAPALLTADDLMRLQPPDKHTELVRGHMIVREPPGFRHGDIAVNLAVVISQFVRARNLGRVLCETGFVLFTDPDTVRGPDVSFVRHAKIPDPVPRGYARFAPDLAIEVLSPDDRPGELLEKVADYLKAGTPLVWVVDPDRRQARVHRADGTISTVGESEMLDGEEVLPGFTCLLADVL
jgi:Uma2 family endonuclease